MIKHGKQKKKNFWNLLVLISAFEIRDIPIETGAEKSRENVDRYWWNIDNKVPTTSFRHRTRNFVLFFIEFFFSERKGGSHFTFDFFFLDYTGAKRKCKRGWGRMSGEGRLKLWARNIHDVCFVVRKRESLNQQNSEKKKKKKEKRKKSAKHLFRILSHFSFPLSFLFYASFFLSF